MLPYSPPGEAAGPIGHLAVESPIMSSGFDSGRASDSPQRRTTGADSHPRSTADPALLEAVLQQTLAMSGAADDATARDLGALRLVVERHRGRPFALEPVAVDLIDALLHDKLDEGKLTPAARRTMVEQIAQSIYEDPVTHGRFQALWTRLSEIRS